MCGGALVKDYKLRQVKCLFPFIVKLNCVSMRTRQSYKLIISTCALSRTYVNIVYIAGGKISTRYYN